MDNVATNIIDFVRVLSSRDKSHNLGFTLRKATGRELWLWWHEAICHEQTAGTDAMARKLSTAVAAEIAKESLRRLGPRSVDNPYGFTEEPEHEAPKGHEPELALTTGMVGDHGTATDMDSSEAYR